MGSIGCKMDRYGLSTQRGNESWQKVNLSGRSHT
jgi:hypothetical protein